MHQNLGYLVAAFAATWVGFFAYLIVVQRLLGETRRRLRWLEEEATRRSETITRADDQPAH